MSPFELPAFPLIAAGYGSIGQSLASISSGAARASIAAGLLGAWIATIHRGGASA